MSQRIIKVLLAEADENTDVLRFYINDEKNVDINLNSDACQSDIKSLFSELLKIEIDDEITFELSIDDGYSKELYKDVCTEYIKYIGRELESSSAYIRSELKN